MSSVFATALRKPVQPVAPRLLKVCVLGPPNVGKSTLVNGLVGVNVSSVSPKEQTTRERVLGILTHQSTQVLFFDTPGIVSLQESRKLHLARSFSIEPRFAALEADLILTMVDDRFVNHPNRYSLMPLLGGAVKAAEILSKPHALVVNKIDLMPPKFDLSILERRAQSKLNTFLRPGSRPAAAKSATPDASAPAGSAPAGPGSTIASKPFSFERVFHTNAVQPSTLLPLKDYLLEAARPAAWLYPADMATDLDIGTRAVEAVRTQLFHYLHQELPYRVLQRLDKCEQCVDGSVDIEVSLLVTKLAQKLIILGRQGRLINTMTAAAQSSLMQSLNRPVRLYIRIDLVKPRELSQARLIQPQEGLPSPTKKEEDESESDESESDESENESEREDVSVAEKGKEGETAVKKNQ
eukprot:m.109587 g.109587  ORF g.109587 m.109587 type:complete len:410 (+) comp14314_c0_seq2:97-1326(+)